MLTSFLCPEGRKAQEAGEYQWQKDNIKHITEQGQAEDAERAAFTASRILRDTLLAAPPRMAAALLGMNDLLAMEKIIRSELSGALNAFSRSLQCEADPLKRAIGCLRRKL